MPIAVAALAALELLGDQRQGGREHRRGAGALKAAGEVEDGRIARRPHANEATVKSAKPKLNTRRRPIRSPIEPATSRNEARVSA